jgi:hypothetical protein
MKLDGSIPIGKRLFPTLGGVYPFEIETLMERQSLGTPLLHAIFRKEAEAIRLALFGNRLALRFDSDRFIAILGYLGAKRSCGQFT